MDSQKALLHCIVVILPDCKSPGPPTFASVNIHQSCYRHYIGKNKETPPKKTQDERMKVSKKKKGEIRSEQIFQWIPQNLKESCSTAGQH